MTGDKSLPFRRAGPFSLLDGTLGTRIQFAAGPMGAAVDFCEGMTLPTIAIAFARVDLETTPNLHGSENDRTAAYYEAICVAYASVRRWNPQVALVLVTNESPPRRYKGLLAEFAVETLITPYTWLPPTVRFFRTSFYVLNAVQALAGRQLTVVIDPDVVCIRPLKLSWDDNAIGAYPLRHLPDEVINGLSRREAASLSALLDGGEPYLAPHYGGECLAIPANAAQAFLERCEIGWKLSLEHARKALPFFPTEEHLISYALRRLAVKDLSPLVRRIWTGPRYRNVQGDEDQLTLWHVPAEKQAGIATLWLAINDGRSWFWQADAPDFRIQAARSLGIAPSFGRLFNRLGRRAKLTVSELRRKPRA